MTPYEKLTSLLQFIAFVTKLVELVRESVFSPLVNTESDVEDRITTLQSSAFRRLSEISSMPPGPEVELALTQAKVDLVALTTDSSIQAWRNT